MDLFVRLGIILGICCNAIYIIIAAIKKKWKHLDMAMAKCILIFLSSNGFIAGVKVCIIAFFSSLSGLNVTDHVYLFIGGFALIWVSAREIIITIYELLRK